MKSELRPGATETNELRMTFAYIPPGSFRMGSTSSSDEEPVHSVQISQAFYLLTTVVTQAMWQAVVGTTIEQQRDKAIKKRRFRAKRSESLYGVSSLHPMYYVSWDETQDFLRQMNARNDGWRYRLPTEAEWEYAARAGTDTKWSFGNDESQVSEYGWYNERWYESGKIQSSTIPVGGKKPNPWGLYDMHGNVWEWVQDWYDAGYYGVSPHTDPQGPSSGQARVLRGGSWVHHTGDLRSACRNSSDPSTRASNIGFRVLRTR